MTEYLTSEKLAEIANDPSNILSYVQSNTWLSLKLNTSARKKGHGFYCCLSKQVLENYFSTETMINDCEVSLG